MDLTVFFGIFICAGLACVKASQKWGYVGKTGPMYWHELFPEACGGKNQSPIDLKPEETTYDPDLKEFAIWYDPPKPESKMYLKNTGHSVQVDLDGEFYVTNGGLQNVYQAVQFHFHWGDKAHRGSEHLVEGQASPLEMHIVTFNKDRFLDVNEAFTQPGGLAVLGVLFQLTKEDNPNFDYVIRGMKYIRDPENVAKIELPLFSLRNLLPDNMERYFRYNGSLTTPGCFESVTWTIFDQMQTLSYRQMEEFRKLMQFKHKRSEEKSSSKHQKREVKADPQTEKEKEHNAKEVLNELGIRGKDGKFERELLKEQLFNGKDSASDTLTIAVRDAGAKPDAVAPPANFLVNNYRPVQKVNGRIVHRSFKLRDPVSVMANEKAEVVKYEAVQFPDAKGYPNSAGYQAISLTLLSLVLAINAFKSLF